MGQQAYAASARVTAEKAINTAPNPTNIKQAALNNLLEIKLGELKLIIAQITAAGGLSDANAAATLATLISQL
jgi:hypothetical protein